MELEAVVLNCVSYPVEPHALIAKGKRVVAHCCCAEQRCKLGLCSDKRWAGLSQRRGCPHRLSVACCWLTRTIRAAPAALGAAQNPVLNQSACINPGLPHSDTPSC